MQYLLDFSMSEGASEPEKEDLVILPSTDESMRHGMHDCDGI